MHDPCDEKNFPPIPPLPPIPTLSVMIRKTLLDVEGKSYEVEETIELPYSNEIDSQDEG